jgi:4-amino-4-deoxy-L-arabinose transferase-like glycosyltransferase
MAGKRPFGLIDASLLLLVLAVAAGGRVGYLLQFADGGASSGPLLVQEPSPALALSPEIELRGKSNPNDLDALVHNLSEHSWFGSLAPFAGKEERTAHTAPGYPWVLSWLAGVVSADDLESWMRWLQCVFGVLTAGLYFLFARRVFQSRLAAVFAGLLTALHPFWIINTACINDGTLTAFLLALVLLLGSIAGQSGGAFSSLLYGASVAGLALMRAALLPFAFVAILWLLWRSRRIERGWLCALLAFLGFANALAPWMIRNFQAFGEPVPITTSAYLNLWEGNNPRASGGPMAEEALLIALAEARGESVLDVREKLAGLPQPERYRSLARDVLAEVRAHPDRACYRRLNAACYFFFSEDLARREQIALFKKSEEAESPEGLERAYPSLLLVSLILMLLLSLFAWRWTYPWRGQAMLMSLALIWVPLPYVLGHAGHLHGPRLPLDGVFLTYAAFVLACLWPATGRALLAGPTAAETGGDAAQKRP